MSRVPLVSVCVPTYQYGRFVTDCIESVLGQTLSDWELVVVDDGSTDETASLVGRYAAAEPRIHYVRNERRLGMNANIKRAADLGRGRYLKILCSDDWLVPNCLEVLCELMERYRNVALVSSAEVYTDADGSPQQVMGLLGEPLSLVPGAQMLDRMAGGLGFGGNSSFLIRASCYRAVGGYNGAVRFAADYELATRLCRVGDYLHTDQPLFFARGHPASSSTLDPQKLLDVQDWFEIPAGAFWPRPAGSREWRRYQFITMRLTARYLLNILLQHARGRHEYARALRRIVWRHGNFGLGIPYLALHAPVRLFNRLSGRNRPPARPLEPWMQPPAWRASGAAARSGARSA